jgi:hypothetical protein
MNQKLLSFVIQTEMSLSSSSPRSEPGFLVGNTRVTRLSGPVSAYFLRPTASFLSIMREHQSRPPLFLFLGDVHESNKGTCKPCNPASASDACVRIDQDDLFALLNHYSSPEHPIHIYLEWYLSKEYKQRISDFSPKKASEFFQSEIESLDPIADGPLMNVTFKHLACFFPDWKQRPGLQSVFHKFCKHSNIQWHHVDMRKIINIFEYGIKDEREQEILLGKYLYEGLLHSVMMEAPFNTFRDLLWTNPKQAAVHFVAECWKFSLTHQETTHLVRTLADLFLSPTAFSSSFFSNTNPMFTSRSVLFKQIQKQITPLQNLSMISKWSSFILDHYLQIQQRDWNQQTYHKKNNPNPNRVLQSCVKYMRLFFETLYQLLHQSSSITSMMILQSTQWSTLLQERPSKGDADYLKQLLEDIGLAATCTFVDLGILLRSFKHPVNKQTGKIESPPYLSICYFGDDHMKSLLSLLVDKLKLYELVPGHIDHVKDGRQGKHARCLDLRHLHWNLQSLASDIGVDLPKALPRTVARTKRISQSKSNSHRRSGKASRCRTR